MSIKHAILALLDLEQGSGYDLRTKFNNSIGSFWSATHQQVYKELATLTESGWVTYEEIEQLGTPAKKVYQVTKEGRGELKRWVQLPAKATKIKDPFLIKVFAGAHLSQDDLVSDIKSNRHLHQETLNAYECLEKWLISLPEELFNHYKLPYATMKLGMKIEKAWLEWSEELIEEMQ